MKAITLLLFLGISHLAASETILYIGDSHSYGKLGTTIEKGLDTIADHVIMEASCGASASTWLANGGFAKTVCGFWKKDGEDEVRSTKHLVPNFIDEVNYYKPNVVIVELGTNMAAGDAPLDSSASINKMMTEIKNNNAECIWIGPPDAHSKIVTKEKLKIVNQLIIKLAKENNCHFIDSLKITHFPQESLEGIHYPPDLAKDWGEKVSTQILALLGR